MHGKIRRCGTHSTQLKRLEKWTTAVCGLYRSRMSRFVTQVVFTMQYQVWLQVHDCRTTGIHVFIMAVVFFTYPPPAWQK